MQIFKSGIVLLCMLFFFALNAFASDTSEFSTTLCVNIHFAGTPQIFPDDYLKPPMSATAILLDPVQDSLAIEKIQRALREELTKYPPELLEQNLRDIYVVKYLSDENTWVGGFYWEKGKRLYLQYDGNPGEEKHVRDLLHHEFAHLLVANHASHFSKRLWQHLNPPTFHYGEGGLESIRNGHAGTDAGDPGSWEQGFANTYGMSDQDEDVACLSEALFSGDPLFWQAVAHYDVLSKKTRLLIAFYHSLSKELTEPYFRQLAPFPREIAASQSHYGPGEPILFPYGGTIYFPPGPNGGPPPSFPIATGGTAAYPIGGTYTMNPKPAPSKLQ